tara:strand:- start:2438 stop:2806 length:369 start_codon:yes stop_codon:yes gene_type:complete
MTALGNPSPGVNGGFIWAWSPHVLDATLGKPSTLHHFLQAMAIFDRFSAHSPSPVSSTADPEKKPQTLDIGMRQIFRPRIIAMAIIVSMGGFIFGKILHMQCDLRRILKERQDMILDRSVGF